MRPLYFILKIVLKYSLTIYYPRKKYINRPKGYFKSTIYACNHAASFMDPLVIGSGHSPIVFFMTRSDIFTPLMRPILWASHMLPIYRQHDGEDTKAKNQKVFEECNRYLNQGRNLLIFSEGFTDDVFIRRLKPIKKGAVRIGFGALESLNWKKNIYIQPVGVNYSNPNKLGSDVLVSYGEQICLNDYRKEYEEQPNKVINDLTNLVELGMRAQITDIRDKDWAPVHEQIMSITRKGMHPDNSDISIPLKNRWEYSKKLANWFNEKALSENMQMLDLKEKLTAYFKELKVNNTNDTTVFKLQQKSPKMLLNWLFFVFTFPLFLWGMIQNYPAYKFTKSFVEKSFKRKVFWGSVKMMMGMLVNAVYNIIFVMFLNYFVYQNPWFWTAYFFLTPGITGGFAYFYHNRWKNFKMKLDLSKKSALEDLKLKRNELLRQIKSTIEVA